MKHIVVDLEMNNIRRKSEARKICTNEIIEIGASMLDENLWEIGKIPALCKAGIQRRDRTEDQQTDRHHE